MIRGMEPGQQNRSPAQYGAWISLALAAVIVLFALAAITWVAAWTTTDLITCLVFGAVLIVVGAAADLAGRYIDTRVPKPRKEGATEATERLRSERPSPSGSPGLKNVLNEVAEAFSLAGYTGTFMIAPAGDGGERVFVVLPEDHFTEWKDSRKISQERLEHFERLLAGILESKVAVVERSHERPIRPAAPPGADFSS